MSSSSTLWSPTNDDLAPLATQIAEFEFTAEAAGTEETTEFDVGGEAARVELFSAAVADGATIKGYEKNAYCAVGSRQDFLSYTHSTGALSKQIRPMILCTDITGSNISGQYTPPIVAGPLTIAIAGFTAGQLLKVRVYIK